MFHARKPDIIMKSYDKSVNTSMKGKKKKFAVKHPCIKNTDLLLKKKSVNTENQWIHSFIDYQNKISDKRTNALKSRLTKISSYYRSLNKKYKLKNLDRQDMFKKLIGYNRLKTSIEDMDNVYSKDTNLKVNVLYKSTKETKKKYRLFENYTNVAKSLLNYSTKFNLKNKKTQKAMFWVFKNKEFINDYNNVKYRFPVKLIGDKVDHEKNLRLSKINITRKSMVKGARNSTVPD